MVLKYCWIYFLALLICLHLCVHYTKSVILSVGPILLPPCLLCLILLACGSVSPLVSVIKSLLIVLIFRFLTILLFINFILLDYILYINCYFKPAYIFLLVS